MIALMLLSAAFGGELVVDVKVPARLALDGELIAEVYVESALRMPVAEGEHALVVTTGGIPKTVPVTIGANPTVVLVGRTGTTVTEGALAVPAESASGDAQVRFLTPKNERLLVQVGKQRVVVPPGAGVSLPLAVGAHPMSVRNAEGTSVFARGTLTVGGGTDLVVQVSEGTLPETSGEGLSFQPGGR